MEEPLISVIVPVYKVEQFLPRCVDSLLSQTYHNLEILLVDDGSPDRCGEICDEYAAKDPRIRVIHKANGGLGSARNAGIAQAKGEYISFIDSDDWVDSDSYSRLYALLLKYSAQMVIAGRYDYYEKSGEERPGLCPQQEEKVTGEEAARRILTWNHMDTAAWDKLYHRSLFASLRYPEGVIHEDYPVTYRAALLCKSCALGDFSFYHYNHRAGSITKSAFNRRDFAQLDAAMEIQDYLSANHPALNQAADYLVGFSLRWTILRILLADESSRREFTPEYRQLTRSLRSRILTVLSNPYFSAAHKRDCFLLAFGIYRLPRAVYHFFKKA